MTSAESAYLFRHALLRDAAYGLQPPAERAVLHALALELLEAWLRGHEAALDTFAGELADHAFAAAQAGHPQAAALRGRELAWLWPAALRALGGFAHADAIRLLDRIADHPAVNPERACEALTRAADVLRLTGRPQEARERLDAALKLDAPRGVLARAQVVRAQLMMRAGDFAGAADVLAGLLEPCGALDRAAQGSIVATQAAVSMFSGNPQAALEQFRRAVALVEGEPQEPWVRNNLAAMLIESGRPEEAERELRVVLTVGTAATRMRTRPAALLNLSTICLQSGRLEESEALARDSMRAARDIGFAADEAFAAANLADQYIDQARLPEAEQLLVYVRAIALEQSDQRALGTNYVQLAFVRWRQGRPAEAESLLKQAVATGRIANDGRTVASALTALATLLVEQGRPDAREFWDQGIEDLRRFGPSQLIDSRIAEMRHACALAGIQPFDAA